jgi:hypothetical protein
MNKNLRIALAVALAAAIPAHAQLYKCKGADGKLVYSDQRCDTSATPAAVAPGVSNRAHAIEEKAAADKEAADKAAAEAKLQAEARVAAERKAAGLPPIATPAANPAAPPQATSGGSTGSTASGRYQLSASDQDRIRNLETMSGRIGASSEQKTAALLEISNIRSGRDAAMSSADRQRRDALTADLSSTDVKKRQQVLNDLRQLYSQ